MMRKLPAALAGSAILALALVGCSSPMESADVKTNQNGPQMYGEMVERTFTLSDGTELRCVVWIDDSSMENGGIDCDWPDEDR